MKECAACPVEAKATVERTCRNAACEAAAIWGAQAERGPPAPSSSHNPVSCLNFVLAEPSQAMGRLGNTSKII